MNRDFLKCLAWLVFAIVFFFGPPVIFQLQMDSKAIAGDCVQPQLQREVIRYGHAQQYYQIEAVHKNHYQFLERFYFIPQEDNASKKLDLLIELMIKDREERREDRKESVKKLAVKEASGINELFELKCVRCHKGEKELTKYSRSSILSAVSGDEMPPKEPLTAQERKVVVEWERQERKPK